MNVSENEVMRIGTWRAVDRNVSENEVMRIGTWHAMDRNVSENEVMSLEHGVQWTGMCQKMK